MKDRPIRGKYSKKQRIRKKAAKRMRKRLIDSAMKYYKFQFGSMFKRLSDSEKEDLN